jgi:hypothetical protein
MPDLGLGTVLKRNFNENAGPLLTSITYVKITTEERKRS